PTSMRTPRRRRRRRLPGMMTDMTRLILLHDASLGGSFADNSFEKNARLAAAAAVIVAETAEA
ncbi:uncharacterized protein SEPMUDRAFT_126058, partial [Sphaerulina musiva SO2202]